MAAPWRVNTILNNVVIVYLRELLSGGSLVHVAHGKEHDLFSP